MPGFRQSTFTRRAAMLTAFAVAGGVAMAGPMIYSEMADFGGPAMMRLVVGMICGGLGAPVLVVAAWSKPTLGAIASIYVPPMAAAVLAALAWSDDYSFSHIAVPLSYVTAVLAFLIIPDRDDSDGGRRCPICGYDRRAHPVGRCPECGNEPLTTTDPSGRRRRWLLHGAALLVAVAVSGTLHTLFLRGILSLG